MAATGLSRRALFGLGLSQLTERVEPDRRLGVQRPPAVDFAERWAAIRDRCDLWDPVAVRLRARCGGGPVSAFGVQSVPDGRRAIGALLGQAEPGRRAAFSTWTTGAVAQLLREAARLDPLPAGVPGAWAWGSRERLRQDLDHLADEVDFAREELELTFAGREDAFAALASGVPAFGAALGAGGDQARDRLDDILASHLVHDGDEVRLAVPYLAVVARRRAE